MNFCSYSSQLIVDNKTPIDNLFITSFMPYAPSDCVKIYLYGLFACNDANSSHNTIEEFAKALNMSVQDIESSFLYWQEQGLVQIIDTIPFEVRYLPIKNALIKHPKISEQKYSSFNISAQEILTGRMITPNEYYEYYATMESLHIEQSALLMIIKYCANLKGDNVGYPYILTVAKNWAKEGITSAQSVNEKLIGFEKQNENLNLILKAMSIKRNADIDERDLYEKWMQMGFLNNVIIYIAKSIKKLKKSVNFKYLDKILEKYYTMNLFSIQEIDAYENNKASLFNLAKSVCKNLGVFYEDIEPVVENYIITWTNMGYDEEILLKISNYCFKSSIRTLENMDKQILKFYKLGITNLKSLDEYFDDILHFEEQIKQILEKLGLSRNINNIDREYYKNWTNNWNMSAELINYAITLSIGKPQPLQYMNKVLSKWHENNIKTVDEAKKCTDLTKETKTITSNCNNYQTRDYTSEQINSLFTNLEEIEI